MSHVEGCDGDRTNLAIAHAVASIGYTVEMLPPYMPEYNLAETAIRVLGDVATRFCYTAGLAPKFLGEAFRAAAHHHNHTVNPSRNNKTPIELLTGQPADVNHLLPFGSIAFIPKPTNWKIKDGQRTAKEMEQLQRNIPAIVLGPQQLNNRSYRLVTFEGELVSSCRLRLTSIDPRTAEFQSEPFFKTPTKLQRWASDSKFQLQAETSELVDVDYDKERPLINDEELLSKLRETVIRKPNGEEDVHLPGQDVPDYMKRFNCTRKQLEQIVLADEPEWAHVFPPNKPGRKPRTHQQQQHDNAGDVSGPDEELAKSKVASEQDLRSSAPNLPQPANMPKNLTVLGETQPFGYKATTEGRATTRHQAKKAAERRDGPPHLRAALADVADELGGADASAVNLLCEKADKGKIRFKDLRDAVLVLEAEEIENEEARQLKWREALNNPRYAKAAEEAFQKEYTALTSKTKVLELIDSKDPEMKTARQDAIQMLCLLNIKRDGSFKCRFVKRGDLMRVDPNLKYRADVIPIYAVRTLLAAHNSKVNCIGILDVATAFLQTGQFKAGTAKRYVKMKDPRTES